MSDEKTAQSILTQLREGANFAELAKEYSLDASSLDSGGDLGWFERGQMVKEFELAVFALEVGEISEPIRTGFGYHIIKLLDRSSSMLSLEEGQARKEIESATIAAREVAETLGYDLVVSSQDVVVFSPSDQFVDLAGLSGGFTDITDFVKDVFTDYAR